MSSNIKRFLIIIFYNLFIISIIFIFLEVLTRLIFPEIKPQGTEKELLAANKYYNSAGFKPNSRGYSNGELIIVDEYGFRKCSLPVDTTKKSWLIIGDSVTMGIGVEADSTFAGILQHDVDSLNILNPSLIGYSMPDYLNVVRALIGDEVLRLRIERVTIFYTLNDVYTDVQDIETPGGNLRYLFGDLLRFLRNNSRLYLLLKKYFTDRPESYYKFDESFYTPSSKQLEHIIQMLAKAAGICASKKIEFDIVLLPYEFQLRKNYTVEESPQSLMKKLLEPYGITLYDPLDFLIRGEFEPEMLYLFGDGIHFSKFGHRLLADFIKANMLIRQNGAGN